MVNGKFTDHVYRDYSSFKNLIIYFSHKFYGNHENPTSFVVEKYLLQLYKNR